MTKHKPHLAIGWVGLVFSNKWCIIMIMPMQNTERAIFRGTGKYNIPIIKPETDIRIDKVLWIPINYAKTQHEPEKCGLHFYKDDYQFERLWNYPDKWIPLLQKFAVVCAPDFSIYKEMPLAMQIYQHFRKHWLAAYWQAHGVRVIPTLCWCGEESYEWCFDGEPTNSIVSISSHGAFSTPFEKEQFSKHCLVALDRLTPSGIMWYGQCPQEFERNATIVKPYTMERSIYG